MYQLDQAHENVATSDRTFDWQNAGSQWPVSGQTFASLCNNRSQYSQPGEASRLALHAAHVSQDFTQTPCNILDSWSSASSQNQGSVRQFANPSPSSSPVHFPKTQPAHEAVITSTTTAASMYSTDGHTSWSLQPQYPNNTFTDSSYHYPSPPQYYNLPQTTAETSERPYNNTDVHTPAPQPDLTRLYAEDYWSRTSTPSSEQPRFVLTKKSDDPFDTTSEPAYAHLLFVCLRAAPDNQLGLRDIYEWMEEHCPRVREGESKGWQNSVRHNLSMNKGFEKVCPPGDSVSKKNTMWRLAREALDRGHVLPTTQYRKKTLAQQHQQQQKKSSPRGRDRPAAPSRASAGAKGGMASKRALEQRRRRSLAGATSWLGPPATSVPFRLFGDDEAAAAAAAAASRLSSPALTDGSTATPESAVSPPEDMAGAYNCGVDASPYPPVASDEGQFGATTYQGAKMHAGLYAGQAEGGVQVLTPDLAFGQGYEKEGNGYNGYGNGYNGNGNGNGNDIGYNGAGSNYDYDYDYSSGYGDAGGLYDNIGVNTAGADPLAASQSYAFNNHGFGQGQTFGSQAEYF